MITQNEIIERGDRALVDSLGVVNTIRFIQYFSQGKGNYTEERHSTLILSAIVKYLIFLKIHLLLLRTILKIYCGFCLFSLHLVTDI
jgi:hypothetical protein